MSRGRILLALVALGGIASGALLVARRSAGSVTPPQPTTITAIDPTWCGKGLGGNTLGELGDPSDCGKLSLTGTAPACLFWAECREVHFSIDCTSAGPGKCRCDGEGGLTVSYDPAFCAIDGTNPKRSLRAILESAAVACRWRPQ